MIEVPAGLLAAVEARISARLQAMAAQTGTHVEHLVQVSDLEPDVQLWRWLQEWTMQAGTPPPIVRFDPAGGLGGQRSYGKGRAP